MVQIDAYKKDGRSNHQVVALIWRSNWVVNNYLNDKENYSQVPMGSPSKVVTPREERRILRWDWMCQQLINSYWRPQQTNASIQKIRTKPPLRHWQKLPVWVLRRRECLCQPSGERTSLIMKNIPTWMAKMVIITTGTIFGRKSKLC